jgi:glycosyltransferase involved in cell wall biosynthesis
VRGRSGDRVRVLTLIDKPISIGGAERVAVDLTLALDPARFDRYFVATRRSPFPQLDGKLKDGGVKYVSLDRRSRSDVLPWGRFLRMLREERIEVLHAHMFGSNFWGSLVGRAGGVPVVVAHEHSWSFVGEAWRNAVDRQVIARLADTIVAVSEADAALMRSVQRIPASKISVIRNGIADPVVTAEPAETRASLGLAADTPVIAAVASIRPEKRLDRLVHAAAIVRRQVPEARVVVAGDGYRDEVERLHRLVHELGLEETVLFLGQRDDAGNVMVASDVGTITSDREGIPLALLEFMALERPVVATAVAGGVPEIIEDGVTGVLVRDLSAEAFAEALVDVLRRPREEREAMGRRARALQQRAFSFDAFTAAVVDLYERLLDRKRRRSPAR